MEFRTRDNAGQNGSLPGNVGGSFLVGGEIGAQARQLFANALLKLGIKSLVEPFEIARQTVGRYLELLFSGLHLPGGWQLLQQRGNRWGGLTELLRGRQQAIQFRAVLLGRQGRISRIRKRGPGGNQGQQQNNEDSRCAHVPV